MSSAAKVLEAAVSAQRLALEQLRKDFLQELASVRQEQRAALAQQKTELLAEVISRAELLEAVEELREDHARKGKEHDARFEAAVKEAQSELLKLVGKELEVAKERIVKQVVAECLPAPLLSPRRQAQPPQGECAAAEGHAASVDAAIKRWFEQVGSSTDAFKGDVQRLDLTLRSLHHDLQELAPFAKLRESGRAAAAAASPGGGPARPPLWEAAAAQEPPAAAGPPPPRASSVPPCARLAGLAEGRARERSRGAARERSCSPGRLALLAHCGAAPGGALVLPGLAALPAAWLAPAPVEVAPAPLALIFGGLPGPAVRVNSRPAPCSTPRQAPEAQAPWPRALSVNAVGTAALAALRPGESVAGALPRPRRETCSAAPLAAAPQAQGPLSPRRALTPAPQAQRAGDGAAAWPGPPAARAASQRLGAPGMRVVAPAQRPGEVSPRGVVTTPRSAWLQGQRAKTPLVSFFAHAAAVSSVGMPAQEEQARRPQVVSVDVHM